MKKLLIIMTLLWSQLNIAQTAIGDYFTYQGELIVNGQAANGNYEFEAQFYDAATNGNNVGNNFNIAATVTDGIFTLQLDIGGGALTGNAGTNPATDFVGTTDSVDLIFKVNNIISARYDENKNYYFGDTNSFNGTGNALISGILSGRDNTFVSQSVFQPVSESVIAGGFSNKIEVLAGASIGVDRATISGGRNNTVTRPYGSIGGGSDNQVNGQYSTIPGGKANIVKAMLIKLISNKDTSQ